MDSNSLPIPATPASMKTRCFRKEMTLLLGLAASSAFGTTLSYDDFSDITGLELSGNAAQAGSVVRLTPAAEGQVGGLFTTTQIALGSLNSFSTYFQFRITDSYSGIFHDSDGIPGAGGLLFVIQTQSNQVGVEGGLGFRGLSPSVGVEFDTWQDGDPVLDPSGNHVGINTNGSLTSLITAVESVPFNNGEIWNAWIDYDGDAQTMEVRWSLGDTRPGAAQLSHSIDFVGIFGPEVEGYFGFTSATGAAYGNHDILKWTLEDSYAPIYSASPVPEPGSAVALALLLSSAVFHRQRGGKRG